MAEKETEGEIKDCVITVPEFWSYKERQALLDASQMAGLNVLGLINENTAGFVSFLLFTKYGNFSNFLIFDTNINQTSYTIILWNIIYSGTPICIES